MLLDEFYVDFTHHNERSNLDRGVADYHVWKSHWCQLDVQYYIWNAMPQREVGQTFTEILAAECQVFGNRAGPLREP